MEMSIFDRFVSKEVGEQKNSFFSAQKTVGTGLLWRSSCVI